MSPGPSVAIKPDESKDSPEYKKRMAIQNGPVLGMTYGNAEQYGMTESLFTSLKDIFEAVIASRRSQSTQVPGHPSEGQRGLPICDAPGRSRVLKLAP
jgi:hypothetical protein